MKDKELFERLDAALQGEILKIGDGYFNTSFLRVVVAHLKKRVLAVNCGIDELSPTDRLAIHVLVEAAGIEVPLDAPQNESKE